MWEEPKERVEFVWIVALFWWGETTNLSSSYYLSPSILKIKPASLNLCSFHLKWQQEGVWIKSNTLTGHNPDVTKSWTSVDPRTWITQRALRTKTCTSTFNWLNAKHCGNVIIPFYITNIAIVENPAFKTVLLQCKHTPFFLIVLQYSIWSQ